jgi:hypothetical protein
MFRKTVAISSLVVLAISLAGAADTPKASATNLTAAQIVDKNVAARGGLAAWRALQAVEMSGKMDAGGNSQRPTVPVPSRKKARFTPPARPAQQVQLPFVMDLERPRKMRVEIQFNGQTAIQVYDGSQGWKLRPFLNRHEVEAFTPEELRLSSAQLDLDGPLIDFAAKGSNVVLEGTDEVDGRKAYNLKVTDKNGTARHVWIDPESFLEIKIEGSPRRLDGKYHPVAIYYRDYRTVSGLVMPYVLETAVEGAKEKERILIDKIVLNPKLDNARFAMPQ